MYILIMNNKIIEEVETYDEACDRAFALETIHSLPVQIKEKNEHNNKKHDETDWMF